MDDVDDLAAELVGELEQLLERSARRDAAPVAVRLEVWAAWHGLGRSSLA